MIQKPILILGGCLLLAACGEAETEQPDLDVTYLFEHRDELDELFAQCNNDPGGFGQSGQCINVFEARERVYIQELRDAIPR